jgi:FkbM family methyltransferase
MAKRATNYGRAFGRAAPRLLWQVECNPPHRGDALRAYRVPGYEAPVWLRTIVSDHATFWQCLVERQYRLDAFPQAAEINRRYEAALAREQTPLIVDAGANIGLAALWFARAFPHATILCVEPDADNFALLERNTAHLGPRVIRLHAAISAEPMRVKIANPQSGYSAKRVAPASEGEAADSVPAFTVDQLIARTPRAHPFIAKIDIEGFQAPLFAKNTGWVGRFDLITLELDDWQFPWKGTSNSFFRALAPHEFDYLLGQESIFCFRHTPETAADTFAI